jgi:hypothetical protein
MSGLEKAVLSLLSLRMDGPTPKLLVIGLNMSLMLKPKQKQVLLIDYYF